MFSIELDMFNTEIIQGVNEVTLERHMMTAMRSAEKEMDQ